VRRQLRPGGDAGDFRQPLDQVSHLPAPHPPPVAGASSGPVKLVPVIRAVAEMSSTD
jgi:hypothetical protein